MPRVGLLLVFNLALLLAAGAWLGRQHQQTEALQVRLTEARQAATARTALAAEIRRLQQLLPDAAELDRLREERAALDRLRRELNDLRLRADQRVRHPLPPADEPTPRGPGPDVPAADWVNHGRSDPIDTVQTVLWAASTGNVDALADSLLLSSQADAILADVPAELRQPYGSNTRLAAALAAQEFAWQSMQILNHPTADAPVPNDETSATLDVKLTGAGGETRVVQFISFKADEGWKLVVPGKWVEHTLERLATRP